MSHKPLTKEAHAEASRVVEVFKKLEMSKMCIFFGADLALSLVNGIINLFDAEAYWRKALKKSNPLNNKARCVHCKVEFGFTLSDKKHKPRCAWRLSQD